MLDYDRYDFLQSGNQTKRYGMVEGSNESGVQKSDFRVTIQIPFLSWEIVETMVEIQVQHGFCRPHMMIFSKWSMPKDFNP